MTATPTVYIAGPYVFYRRGYTMLDAMRRATEALGYGVSLPNDKELALDRDDLRSNADTIFANCAESMNVSDAIVCDLEFYRGFEPDGGSVYELGMAYARGIRCYGFTRDLRAMAVKDPTSVLDGTVVRDSEGRPYPYADLPFCPSIVGAVTLVEGDYYDALAVLQRDVNWARVEAGLHAGTARSPRSGSVGDDVVPGAREDASDAREGGEPGAGRPRVYLAGPERYHPDAAWFYERMVVLGAELGLDVVTPLDDAPGVERAESPDPYTRAGNDFARWQAHVRGCDAVVAGLDDYHGREPNSDTSFECGTAFQLGKRLFGYMEDARPMRERIANLGPEGEYRDQAGSNVENFDYPINLMFASSMPIYEGGAERGLREAAAILTAS